MEDQIVRIIGVFIPIVAIIVAGMVVVTNIYFNSKEKQMLIDKGFTDDELKIYFNRKQDSHLLLRAGIVLVFLGIGIGLGNALDDMTTKDYYLPVFIISFTGIGLVISHFGVDKYKKSLKEHNPDSK